MRCADIRRHGIEIKVHEDDWVDGGATSEWGQSDVC